MKRRRIALYGGTFDPVHLGHIAVARELLKSFAFDEVLLIPAHIAPHKRNEPPTSALQRYAMLALATQDEPQLHISSVELDAPERPYTVETLARLKDEMGASTRLFFVMGADSWSDITAWREWERLLSLTDHVVVTRPGYEVNTSHVTPEIRERIFDLRGADAQTIKRAIEEKGSHIFLTDAVQMDVSATEIRRALRERSEEIQQSPETTLLPAPVAEFIEKYRLYRKTHETERSGEGKGRAHS